MTYNNGFVGFYVAPTLPERTIDVDPRCLYPVQFFSYVAVLGTVTVPSHPLV